MAWKTAWMVLTKKNAFINLARTSLGKRLDYFEYKEEITEHFKMASTKIGS
jgi:hypothetical protein